ncbi:MAG: GTPase ObgE [Chloroflexi bacterium]|nr:GTPase ObgE [Chloroflexota bacterium]
MSQQFLDEARVFVKSGDGGDGRISFRREKFAPRGGPDGGDGGHGGHVVVVANPKINTLQSLANKVHFRAESGIAGGIALRTGSTAPDLVIEVPVGTIIRDDEGNLVADLTRAGQRVIVARGGRGGKGNTKFKSSTNQAPRIAEKGEPGVEIWLNLELKLMADVGIVGVPNAGKSTLLSVISNAKPKVADYPFTTLIPNLGLVRLDYRDMVVADIPGLVEGASQGVGLGHDFLKHIQRTRVLIHMLDGSGSNPMADYHQINTELALFDEKLLERPTVVVINKMDLPQAQAAWPKLEAELRKLGKEPMALSAATQQGTRELIYRAFELLDSLPAETEATLQEADEIAVYRLGEDDMAFQISRRMDGSFQVSGKRIERAAQMTYWDYDEALMRFQKILEAMGVSAALVKAGVKAGDSVYIGEMELEWGDEGYEEDEPKEVLDEDDSEA